jgi:hypothetical protein
MGVMHAKLGRERPFRNLSVIQTGVMLAPGAITKQPRSRKKAASRAAFSIRVARIF